MITFFDLYSIVMSSLPPRKKVKKSLERLQLLQGTQSLLINNLASLENVDIRLNSEKYELLN